MMFGHRPGKSLAKASGGFPSEVFILSNQNFQIDKNMKPRIVFKLTMNVPGTKLLVDLLFGTKEELENFLNLNKLKPFEVKMVINRNGK
jgi:hypothetical protein